MAKKQRTKHPVTPAVRVLRAAKVDFEPALYDYQERGGTRHSSACLGVDEHHVIKTIVLEDGDGRPLIALMHGDRSVSTKNLARHLGVRTVRPCDPATAQKHTGYLVGGTSPFGTRKRMPVFAPESLLALDMIWINGGKRGFLVRIRPEDVRHVLNVQVVDRLDA